MIVSDDQGPWALGCAGNREIVTPCLDGLAAAGTRLSNFYCTSPVCSPARASLLTGWMPSKHGIHDALSGPMSGPEAPVFLPEQSGYATDLAHAGYNCAMIGKWHLGASDRPHSGFEHWFVLEGGGSDYWHLPMFRRAARVDVDGYATDVFADAAVQFVHDSMHDSRPFCLNLWFTAPHSPWVGVHPQHWVDLYRDCPFESCPQESPHPWTRSPAQNFFEYRQAIANPIPSLVGYFAAVTAMDAAIARVVDSLDRLDILESTVVVFLSDNGFSAGHHGVWGKGNATVPQNMFENSVRVPAIFSQPGRIVAGSLRSELVSGYDLRPTLLALAGVSDPEPEVMPGKSIMPLLTGGTGGHDRIVVFSEYGPTRMIRYGEWKYVHRYPYGPHELYNLKEDAEERRNLVGDASQRELASSLREMLADWFVRFGDPRLDGAKEAVTGRGQAGLVGPRGKGREAFEREEREPFAVDPW